MSLSMSCVLCYEPPIPDYQNIGLFYLYGTDRPEQVHTVPHLLYYSGYDIAFRLLLLLLYSVLPSNFLLFRCIHLQHYSPHNADHGHEHCIWKRNSDSQLSY